MIKHLLLPWHRAWRKPYLYCALLLVGFGLCPTLQAQVESDERPLLVSPNGISFQKDSLFFMSLRFRMQNRMGYFSTLDGIDAPGFEAVVRRLRLRLDGFVMTRKVGYYIQLSFSRNDQDLASGTIAQTVRDAMIFYTINPRLYFGFGQTKLPGNRERVISSGNLQLPDRSVANSAYTIDRDFGFFGYYTQPIGRTQQIILKGAISEGEGRGQLYTNEGLSYTGRIEWLPTGPFQNLGDYSSGDQEFEPKPKLSLGLTLNHNMKTIRTGGQLGSFLPVPVNLKTMITDMIIKYRGWGLLTEYFHRKAFGLSHDMDHYFDMKRVGRGQAFNVQLSKLFAERHEIVLRYAGVNPEKSVEDFQYVLRTKALGYNYYLNHHRVKFLYYIGLDDRRHPGTQPTLLHTFENRLNMMVQVELGI